MGVPNHTIYLSSTQTPPTGFQADSASTSLEAAEASGCPIALAMLAIYLLIRGRAR